MNSVTLSGHLTQDPELVHRNDRPVCEMRLAVDNGKHATTYIDVVTFDEQAFICAEYMRKGSKIGVEGHLVYREWRNAKDQRRERYSVIGRVEFLDRPPRKAGTEASPAAPEPSSDRGALALAAAKS
jgi:single-strand DNA-binding protein